MEKDIEALVKKMNGDIAAYLHFMCWMNLGYPIILDKNEEFKWSSHDFVTLHELARCKESAFKTKETELSSV